MCNLNDKDDSTIKLLNLVLFYKGGTGGGGGGGGWGIRFLCFEFIQIQNVITQLIFEMLEKIFQLSTSLE